MGVDLQIIYLIRDYYPKYINNSYNSIARHITTSFKKWVKKKRVMDPNRHFSKYDIQMNNRYMNGVFRITNHQGNVNQNHNELSLHICNNSFHPRIK